MVTLITSQSPNPFLFPSLSKKKYVPYLPIIREDNKEDIIPDVTPNKKEHIIPIDKEKIIREDNNEDIIPTNEEITPNKNKQIIPIEKEKIIREDIITPNKKEQIIPIDNENIILDNKQLNNKEKITPKAKEKIISPKIWQRTPKILLYTRLVKMLNKSTFSQIEYTIQDGISDLLFSKEENIILKYQSLFAVKLNHIQQLQSLSKIIHPRNILYNYILTQINSLILSSHFTIYEISVLKTGLEELLNANEIYISMKYNFILRNGEWYDINVLVAQIIVERYQQLSYVYHFFMSSHLYFNQLPTPCIQKFQEIFVTNQKEYINIDHIHERLPYFSCDDIIKSIDFIISSNEFSFIKRNQQFHEGEKLKNSIFYILLWEKKQNIVLNNDNIHVKKRKIK